MARLIDADELRNRCEIIADSAEWFNHEQTTWMEAAKTFADMVDEAPTIDAAPVRRGEWEMAEEKAFWVGDEGAWMLTGEPTSHKVPRCTRCKSVFGSIVLKYNFCPACGADMRGVSE